MRGKVSCSRKQHEPLIVLEPMTNRLQVRCAIYCATLAEKVLRSEHLITVRIFKNNMDGYLWIIWLYEISSLLDKTLLYILFIFIYFIISFFICEYNYFDIVFLDRNKANGLLHMQLAEPVKLEVSVTVMPCSV